MAPTGRFRNFYLSHFSRPTAERVLYRTIRRHQVRSIVELGIGIGCRAVRMIEVAAASTHDVDQIRYAGIDLFEGRSAMEGPGVPLKMAFRLLNATGARVRLIPGDPYGALARHANTLTRTDLVIIAGRHDPTSLRRAWFYLPRMLHKESMVLIEQPGNAGQPGLFEPVDAEAIRLLASQAAHRRAA